MEYQQDILSHRQPLRAEHVCDEKHDDHREDEQGPLPIGWRVVRIVDCDESLDHTACEEAAGSVPGLPGEGRHPSGQVA